jgi:hypothetical protein
MGSWPVEPEIVVAPGVTPVATPVVEPTVATLVLLLVQVAELAKLYWPPVL